MVDSIAVSAAPLMLTGSRSSLADNALIETWLHGRSPNTIRAYRRDVGYLLAFAAKPLALVTLAELQTFADSLAGRDSSRARTIKACKSLLAFAERTGAIPFNVGAALRVPKCRETLADRILSVREVKRLLKAAASPRDAALMALLYQGAFRRSELVGLRWSDVAEAEDGDAFLTVVGKGVKTRTVRISREVWTAVAALRGDAQSDGPIFAGRSGGLDASSVWLVVRRAAQRAGLKKNVSPHFLRHSHASNALDAGASIVLVQTTLGHSSIATTGAYLHARPRESSGKYLR